MEKVNKMKNINVDKRLKKFLKKHKAWKKFKKNVKAYDGKCDITSLSHSFDWVDTKEGSSYWINLHIKYRGNKNG